MEQIKKNLQKIIDDSADRIFAVFEEMHKENLSLRCCENCGSDGAACLTCKRANHCGVGSDLKDNWRPMK